MYILLDNQNYIKALSVNPLEGGVEAPEPNDDVVKWFATGKYKFVNNEYVIQENWSEPQVDLENGF